MARPLRIEIPGGLYHIAAHGNGLLWLFKDDKDRQKFLTLLGECATKYKIIIHAFVLMINHFHLLVEISLPNLSNFMRKFLSAYGINYNLRYHRRGSVFKSRYGSFIVQKDSYYLMVVRYLYYNPVRVGLTNNPFEYRWSSLYYLINDSLIKEVSWYNTKYHLEMVGGGQGLHDLISSEIEEPPIFYHMFIGDKEWAEMIFKKCHHKLDDEISQQHDMKKELVKPSEIIDLTAQTLGVADTHIITDLNTDARSICLYLLHKYTPLSDKEIGKLFQMSKWAVSKAVARFGMGKGDRLKLAEKLGKQLIIAATPGKKMSNVQT